MDTLQIDKLLPPFLIKTIVHDYAKSPNTLRWKRQSFSNLNSDINLEKYGVKNADNIAALYYMKGKKGDPLFRTFLINSDVIQGDLISQVIVILHEIQHANQHLEWIKASPERKFQILKNYANKLPKAIWTDELEFMKNNSFDELEQKDINMLSNYPLWIILQFWEEIYGYDQAPDEIEAKQYSFKNSLTAFKKYFTPELFKKIYQEFGLPDEMVEFFRSKGML